MCGRMSQGTGSGVPREGGCAIWGRMSQSTSSGVARRVQTPSKFRMPSKIVPNSTGL